MTRHLRLPAPDRTLAGRPAATGWRALLSRWMSWNSVLFVILFAAPVAIVTTYSLFLSTDRYVSEARFIVRGLSTTNLNGLAMMFRAFGIGNVKDDAFAIIDYMQSRDAVADLSKRLPLAEILNPPGADAWSGYGRIWSDRTEETLYKQYRRYVKIYHDAQSGITTLEVQSFRPETSHAVAKVLLRLGEEVANRMNERARNDSINHAEEVQRTAEERVIAAQGALSEFRNRELLFDPNSSMGSTVQLINALTTELAGLRVQIQETRERAPLNPSLTQLEARATALKRQIDEQRDQVVGGDKSIASKMAAYERLVLERDFADRALLAASNATDQARQEARQQHIYVETIANPNLPDESTEPKNWQHIATALLFGGLAYSTVWLLMVGAREHADVET